MAYTKLPFLTVVGNKATSYVKSQRTFSSPFENDISGHHKIMSCHMQELKRFTSLSKLDNHCCFVQKLCLPNRASIFAKPVLRP